jgi:hypothetical protein
MEQNATKAYVFMADTNIIISTIFPVPLFAHIFDTLQIPVDMGSFSEYSFSILIGHEGRDKYSHSHGNLTLIPNSKRVYNRCA